MLNMRSLILSALLLAPLAAQAQQSLFTITEVPPPPVWHGWSVMSDNLPVCKSGWRPHVDGLTSIPFEYTIHVDKSEQPFVVRDANGRSLQVVAPGQVAALDCFDEDDL